MKKKFMYTYEVIIAGMIVITIWSQFIDNGVFKTFTTASTKAQIKHNNSASVPDYHYLDL